MQLYIILDPRRLDEAERKEETPGKNHATYHQNCRLMFTQSATFFPSGHTMGSRSSIIDHA